MHSQNCKICGIPFNPKDCRGILCSTACRAIYKRIYNNNRYPSKGKWLLRKGLRRCVACKKVKVATSDFFVLGKASRGGLDYVCLICKPGLSRAQREKNGSKVIGAVGLRFKIFKRDSFRCQYCGRNGKDVILHADHVVPAKSGGETTFENLITSCQECNIGKCDILLTA
jgi:hypothetical protein